MLILTRKAGESLYIGDDIRLTVLGTQGKQIKLGITLPDDMTVYREEIYSMVADENMSARQTKAEKLQETITRTFELQTRLGVQNIAEDKIIFFPKGLIGYEDEQRFTLIHFGKESPFYMLQSLKTADLGLIVIDPYIFLEDYSVKISEGEQKVIEVKSSKDLFVFVTVTVPYGKPELTAMNLAGPIFINYEKRIALQVPQDVKNSKVLIADCAKKEEEKE